VTGPTATADGVEARDPNRARPRLLALVPELPFERSGRHAGLLERIAGRVSGESVFVDQRFTSEVHR
jgi:hypothetical protein